MDKFLQFLSLTRKAGKLILGYNKCIDAISYNKIKLMILSVDCAINTEEKFTCLCNASTVPCIKGYSKEELGAALGIGELKVIGITDAKMSEKLIKLWNEKSIS